MFIKNKAETRAPFTSPPSPENGVMEVYCIIQNSQKTNLPKVFQGFQLLLIYEADSHKNIPSSLYAETFAALRFLMYFPHKKSNNSPEKKFSILNTRELTFLERKYVTL